MKLCYLTEKQFEGKIPDHNTNWLFDMLEQYALDAYHLNINVALRNPERLKEFDAVLIIPPKTNLLILKELPKIKQYTKFILLQEGVRTTWQNYSLDEQWDFLNCIYECDLMLTHNKTDELFFKGIKGSKVRARKTMINLEHIKKFKDLTKRKTNIVIQTGNCLYEYNTAATYHLLKNFSIIQPTATGLSGNNIKLTSKIVPSIIQFPWQDNNTWLSIMNNARFCMNLVNQYGAGSMSLMCAALGIPVVGNHEVDAQRKCFPNCSTDPWNLIQAKKLIERLTNDEKFYKETVKKAEKEIANFDYQVVAKETLKIIKEELLI